MATKKKSTTAVKAPAPKNRCYFPSTEADAFPAVRKAIEKRFEVLSSNVDSVTFRWSSPDSPALTLTSATRADATRLMRAGQKRSLARRTPRFESFVVLSFDDLDEVLDETNTLIEAQHVVTKVTKGPMFNAWNKKFVTADGDDIGVFSKF